jgi:diguanylate cyclase (GGDEF)-like protein
MLPPHTTMDQVEALLRESPDCPGVLTVHGDMIHLFDRARMDSIMLGGLGFGPVLQARKPLAAVIEDPALVLPAAMLWDDAARAALSRPVGRKNFPVVVAYPDGAFGIAPVGPLVEFLSDSYAALALRDSLTGLGNRRMLSEMLAAFAANRPIAVLLFDLDRFKEINTALGHQGGDQVIQHCGAVLAEHCGSAFRLGGDEFVVLVEDPRDDLEALARRILGALHEPITIDGVRIQVEASLGIVRGPASEALLAKADAAMFAAKRDRTVIELWRPELRAEHQTDLSLQAELRSAIADGQLVLHYQPLVDPSGRVRSVEALVRWQHPDRGLLAPGAFLPQAERSAVITDLTDRVLADAVAQAARWRADGLHLPVAVNLAAPVLAQDRFVGVIRSLLEQHRLPGGSLIVEITESAVVTRPERAARRLDAVRDLGVRVAMDDFGTGYTSLALLTQLPLDELKLDRAFVNRIHHPMERVIVEAVARMANGLGLTLVAEGVEDQHTADVLSGLGFDLLQGYHFSRPVPPAELATKTQLARSGADR